MKREASNGASGRAPWASRALAITVVVIGVLAMMLGGTAAFGAASGTAFAPCLVLGNGADVHYVEASAPAADRSISGVVLTGLDPTTCNGQPVVVTFSGNTAGNPDLPADEPLAVLDSSLDPCSGVALKDPVVVTAGAITLSGCSTATDPNGASYINIHDVTQTRVQVNGQEVTVGPTTSVLGETFTKSGSPNVGAPGTGQVSGRDLPFTGTWAALTFWLGLLLIVAGVVALYLGRRRRDVDPASPSAP